MKKLIFLIGLIVAMHTNTKAQQQNQLKVATGINTVHSEISLQDFYLSKNKALLLSPGPEKDYNYYLRKSKNQRIVGWATLGGGLVLGGFGILALSSANNYHNSGRSYFPVVLFAASALSGLTSIPFFIMAGSNKQKAKAMLNTQKTGFGVPPGVSKSIVGITIQIPIGS